jgi:hypothetical protein
MRRGGGERVHKEEGRPRVTENTRKKTRAGRKQAESGRTRRRSSRWSRLRKTGTGTREKYRRTDPERKEGLEVGLPGEKGEEPAESPGRIR